MAKIVNDYGDLYRLSDAKYKKYLAAGVAGQNPLPVNYGTFIGTIAFHATDATKTDYEVYLEIENNGNTPSMHTKSRK